MIRAAVLRALCVLVTIADGLLTTEAPTPWRGIDREAS